MNCSWTRPSACWSGSSRGNDRTAQRHAATLTAAACIPSTAMMIGVRADPRSMMMFTCPTGLLTQCRNASMEFSNVRAASIVSTHESTPRKNLRVPWCCMQIFTPPTCAISEIYDIQGKSGTL